MPFSKAELVEKNFGCSHYLDSLIIPVGLRFLFDDWFEIIFVTSYGLFMLTPP
jgi:hypothetical protein